MDAIVLGSIAFLQKLQNEIKKKTVLKCKKLFLFEKIDKNIQINSLFLGNSVTIFCVRVRQDWKKLSVWSSVLFTVSALEMCESKAYRKQKGSNVLVFLNKVSTLEHDRFMQVSL